MKIGIYDPYLDSLGGGEKYMLTIASVLSESHEVFLFWDHETILPEAEKRFSIPLGKVKLTKNIFSSETSVFIRMIQTNMYDCLFFLSDGSIPWLFAKKNILLFQFPVPWVNGKNITTRLKMAKVQTVLSNSYFVKAFIDKTFQVKSQVLAPPVTMIEGTAKKENVILTVGRFTKGMNMKKQEELMDIFISLLREGLSGWRFVLIGAALPSDQDFVDMLKKKAKGYPIDILVNVSWDEVVSYYQKADIYWHGAGYAENLIRHPERAEHFGIATAEAMSAGCIPIVFNGGGQKEIVEEGENGFLWDTPEQLREKTKQVIKNKKLALEISKKAKKKAREFSEKHFAVAVKKLL